MRNLLMAFALVTLGSSAQGAQVTPNVNIARQLTVVSGRLDLIADAVTPANYAQIVCYRMGRISMELKNIQDSADFATLDWGTSSLVKGHLAELTSILDRACDVQEGDSVRAEAGVMQAQKDAVAAIAAANKALLAK